MGKIANSPVISCCACGLSVEMQPDGSYQFDVSTWSGGCAHADIGSPALCPHFGSDLKMAVINASPRTLRSAEED